jgi:hypothetical protein
MTTLNNLNCYLDEMFEELYPDEEYLEDWECEEDALNYFIEDFKDRFNSDIDYFYEEAKEMLHFDEAMEVCRYVDDHYEGWSAPSSDFGDKMLKMYIYFYMEEKHKGEFIEKIKKYFEPDLIAEVVPITETEGTEEVPVAEPIAQAIPIVEAAPAESEDEGESPEN